MQSESVPSRKVKDITGAVYGSLTVVSFSHLSDNRRSFWNCVCKCGNNVTVSGGHLQSGNTISCGCVRKANLKAGLHASHRGFGTDEYGIWSNMLSRCTNPNTKRWARYGGRGITVCEAWQTDFTAFLRDVGPRPGPEYQLDRKDNNGNYEPGNVQWSTRVSQGNNKSNNRRISANGKTQTLSEWARELGLNVKALSRRLERMTEEEALHTASAT